MCRLDRDTGSIVQRSGSRVHFNIAGTKTSHHTRHGRDRLSAKAQKDMQAEIAEAFEKFEESTK